MGAATFAGRVCAEAMGAARTQTSANGKVFSISDMDPLFGFESNRRREALGDHQLSLHDFERQGGKRTGRGTIQDLASVLRVVLRLVTRAEQHLILVNPFRYLAAGVRADRGIGEDAIRRAGTRLG